MASNLPAVYRGKPLAKRVGLLKVLFGGEDEEDKKLREAIAELERDKVLSVETLRHDLAIGNATDQARLKMRNEHLKNRSYALAEREVDMETVLGDVDFLDISPRAKLRLKAGIRRLYGVDHNGIDPLGE